MKNIVKELEIIKNSNISQTEKRERLLQYHPYDIAFAIKHMEQKDRFAIYNILDDSGIARIVPYFTDSDIILEDFEDSHIASILNYMDMDKVVDFLLNLDDEDKNRIMALLPDNLKSNIYLVQEYHSFCIGSKITNNYIALNSECLAGDAMDIIKHESANKTNLAIIYIVDSLYRYIGIVKLSDLIRLKDNEPISKIIKASYPFFLATDLIEECVTKFREYKQISYPIVDSKHKLLGVISSDDLFKTIDFELSDDYSKLCGLTESEKANDSILDIAKKRLPWLVILLVLGLFESFALTGFKNVFLEMPILIFFQIVLLGTTGNAGMQSLGSTIRSLSPENRHPKTRTAMVIKSFWCGVVNGLVIGIVSFVLVFIFMYVTRLSITSEMYNVKDALEASILVSMTLVISITIATLLGTIIPLVLSSIHIDLSNANGPFIATVMDIIALVVFYLLIVWMFKWFF